MKHAGNICHIMKTRKPSTRKNILLVKEMFLIANENVICRSRNILKISYWKLVTSTDRSHKKRNDSFEGSLDRVLFVAELDFPKILVPRLPQETSNLNNDCPRKPKQLYSSCDQPLYMEHWCLYSIVLILTSYLLKRGTTWNHLLKPSETTQKLHETTWNYLKPAIL